MADILEEVLHSVLHKMLQKRFFLSFEIVIAVFKVN